MVQCTLRDVVAIGEVEAHEVGSKCGQKVERRVVDSVKYRREIKVTDGMRDLGKEAGEKGVKGGTASWTPRLDGQGCYAVV